MEPSTGRAPPFEPFEIQIVMASLRSRTQRDTIHTHIHTWHTKITAGRSPPCEAGVEVDVAAAHGESDDLIQLNNKSMFMGGPAACCRLPYEAHWPQSASGALSLTLAQRTWYQPPHPEHVIQSARRWAVSLK